MKPRLFILLLLSVFSCKKESSIDLINTSSCTKELIGIDFSNPEYRHLRLYANDTITADGWEINYLVKNDTTRFRDLYIRWSKDDISETYVMEDNLLLRGYFTPSLVENNANFIYMSHACATSCSSLLVLSKEPVPKARDFIDVVDYDFNLDQVVYIPESSHILGDFKVAVSDLKRGINKSVKFKNQCYISPTNGCVDSITFNEKHIKIFCDLLDPETNEAVRETYRIELSDNERNNIHRKLH